LFDQRYMCGELESNGAVVGDNARTSFGDLLLGPLQQELDPRFSGLRVDSHWLQSTM